jgi:hypothetical protein
MLPCSIQRVTKEQKEMNYLSWAERTDFKQSSQVRLLLRKDVSGCTNAMAEEGW